MEKDVLKGIIGYLSYYKIWWERMNSGSILSGDKEKGNFRAVRLAKKGCPDLVCCIKGMLIGIETKRDKEEYDNWIRIVNEYKKTKEIKKSWQHVIDQYLYALDMVNSGAEYVLTYSTDHLHEELTRIKEKYKM